MLSYSNNTIKINIVFLLVLISIFSCKKVEVNDVIQSNKLNDTILIEYSKCNIFDLKFNQGKLLKIKNKYSEEDFYIIADDANFYTSKAHDFLANKTSSLCNLKMDSNNVLLFENKYSIKYTDLSYGDFIFFKEGKKPIIVSLINFEKVFLEYFGAQLDTVVNIENNVEIPNIVKSFAGEYDSGLEINIDEKTKSILGNLNYEAEVTDCKLTFTGQIGEMKENVLPIKIEGFNYIGTGKMFFKENSIIIKFDEETPSYCQRVLPFENNEIEFYKE